jgi:hypothetical protein
MCASFGGSQDHFAPAFWAKRRFAERGRHDRRNRLAGFSLLDALNELQELWPVNQFHGTIFRKCPGLLGKFARRDDHRGIGAFCGHYAEDLTYHRNAHRHHSPALALDQRGPAAFPQDHVDPSIGSIPDGLLNQIAPAPVGLADHPFKLLRRKRTERFEAILFVDKP